MLPFGEEQQDAMGGGSLSESAELRIKTIERRVDFQEAVSPGVLSKASCCLKEKPY
jgi:hypothetical protein